MPLLPKILPRAELHKQRAAVPPVASELQKSLDKVFIKILSGATLDCQMHQVLVERLRQNSARGNGPGGDQ